MEETNEQDQAPANDQPIILTAYCTKTKKKNVPILEAVITKTAKNAYMCKGVDEEGNKLVTLVNKEKAEAAVAAGIATKGWE